MTDQITPSQFHESEGVEDWHLISERRGSRNLKGSAFFRTRMVGESSRFVQSISELSGLRITDPMLTRGTTA